MADPLSPEFWERYDPAEAMVVAAVEFPEPAQRNMSAQVFGASIVRSMADVHETSSNRGSFVNDVWERASADHARDLRVDRLAFRSEAIMLMAFAQQVGFQLAAPPLVDRVLAYHSKALGTRLNRTRFGLPPERLVDSTLQTYSDLFGAHRHERPFAWVGNSFASRCMAPGPGLPGLTLGASMMVISWTLDAITAAQVSGIDRL